MIKIGILGGGQLGLMLHQAAISYPAKFYFLDSSKDCPCAKVSPNFVEGDFADYQSVLDFGINMDVLSIEIEQVNTEALKELKKQGKKIIPDPEVLEIIQNKRKQKKFYIKNGLPTSPFAEENQYPFVAKLEEGGYDGKGVEVIDSEEKKTKLFSEPYFAEKKADIKKELSVLVLKSETKILVSPVVEQVFCPIYNLVDYLICPAQIPKNIEEKAQTIAKNLVEKFAGEGLFAVELFWNQDDSIWINEVAPRLHNSGHVGMETWNFSQFDALARLLIGVKPFENWHFTEPSAMINLIGNVKEPQPSPFVDEIRKNQLENCHLHWYHKDLSKAGRKMGHLNLVANTVEDLLKEISAIKLKLENTTI